MASELDQVEKLIEEGKYLEALEIVQNQITGEEAADTIQDALCLVLENAFFLGNEKDSRAAPFLVKALKQFVQ